MDLTPTLKGDHQMATHPQGTDQSVPIHNLIAQAAGLAAELAKARRVDLAALRERATELVDALDAEHPTQSAIQQVLALVRDLAEGDSGAPPERLRERAQRLPDAVTGGPARSRQRALPTSTRDVDAWTLEMFGATESAIPRESLVEEFVTRYRRERRIENSERHQGPWLFEFEAESARGQILGIRPLVGAGLHPDAFEQRCRDHLPAWQSDPFLAPLLGEQGDIDGWYALPFGGSPLFDALLDIRRHTAGEPDYWINGVALPGDGRHETRAIVTLYRNLGDPLWPEPPSIMRQDMRLLTVLGLAWRQLEHQVRALARVSEADRRDLINLIAPGLLHHEIGFNMRTAYGQAYEQFNLLQRIAAETGNPQVELATRYAHGIAGLVLRLYQITDAFNNLDRRARVEDSDLDRVFSEIKTLLHHRLGHANTEFVWDGPAFKAQVIHTDVVLLSQAIINIVNNALNALVEYEIKPPRRIRAHIVEAHAHRIALTLINNGPPIPAKEAQNIFRRGYTTRIQGHGQGLYLARLVAHYLGGEVSLLDASALLEDFHAGFRFSFNRRLPAEQGVARETL